MEVLQSPILWLWVAGYVILGGGLAAIVFHFQPKVIDTFFCFADTRPCLLSQSKRAFVLFCDYNRYSGTVEGLADFSCWAFGLEFWSENTAVAYLHKFEVVIESPIRADDGFVSVINQAYTHLPLFGAVTKIEHLRLKFFCLSF